MSRFLLYPNSSLSIKCNILHALFLSYIQLLAAGNKRGPPSNQKRLLLVASQTLPCAFCTIPVSQTLLCAFSTTPVLQTLPGAFSAIPVLQTLPCAFSTIPSSQPRACASCAAATYYVEFKDLNPDNESSGNRSE